MKPTFISSLCTLPLLAGRAFGVPATCSGGWRDLTPIPSVRQEHATVAISDSSFAILGGIVRDPQFWATTNQLQFYDVRTDSWHNGAPFPQPLNHPNAAAVDGKIYLLGGLAVGTTGNWEATSAAWAYDIDRDIWQYVEPQPEDRGVARGSAAMGVYGSVIWLAGGMTVLELSEGGRQWSVPDVSAYDTASNTWLDLPPAARELPAPRDHAGVAVVEHTMYVIGGRDGGQTNLRDTVFALDLRHPEDGWQIRKSRMPTARGGLAAAAVGHKIYTFGGEGNPANSTGVFGEVEAYNTLTDTWEELEPMKLPRHGTAAVSLSGRVYIPGGGVAQGGAAVDTLDMFVPNRALTQKKKKPGRKGASAS